MLVEVVRFNKRKMLKFTQMVTLIMVSVLVSLVFAGCSKTGDPTADADGGMTEEEPQQVKDAEGDGFKIVSNGVLFTVPRDYSVTVEDETGNIYIDDPDLDFNIVMVVRDGSYEESLEDKDGLTANARKQDVTILKDITEYTAAGKSYAYFTFEYNDHSSTNTVIYTGAVEGKRIGINMMINADDITEEDVIDRINVFLKTAEATGLADTTADDLYDQEGLNDASFEPEGESIDQTELKLGDTAVTIAIPEGYLYQTDMDAYEEGMFCKQYFDSSDLSEVTLSLYAEGMYDDLKELVNAECIVNDNAGNVKTEGPKKTDHKGKTLVYKTVSYSYDGTKFNKAIAACELPDKSVYTVLIQNLDGKELSLDDIREFLTFEKE
ncbi:MAG: hypothetical protein K6A71_06885 [Lachnospiraceae bacterium]|nr:hypothetical protein [Lachnospiraceae bacterium]